MSADNEKIVKLPNLGEIKGNIKEVKGKKVHEFLSVPYAEAPIKDLRFKKPVAVKPWKDVLDATKRKAAPWQMFFRNFGGSHKGEEVWNPKEPMDEDCLHVNVWAPAEHTEPLPVMVWIYGGGFATGTASLDIYDGCQLAAEGGVIVVSLNYRVSSLGFLCLGTEEAPGNQGLWDQLEALKWVKQNIGTFGGNSNNVTLFGESAGSVSVSCHLLSPHSHDFFHRAILQSGTAINLWGVLPKKVLIERSEKLAKVMLTSDSTASKDTLLSRLRDLPAKDFTEKDWVVEGMFQWPWVPMVDGDFFPDSPQKLIEQGKFKKCPVILGSNLNEASYFLIYNQMDLFKLDEKLELTQETFLKAIQANFSHYPYHPLKMSALGMGAIASEYFPSDTNANETFYQQLDYAVGDLHLACDTLTLADAYASSGQSVYVYLFARRAAGHPWPQWAGVMHGDEIQFIFGLPRREGSSRYSQEDSEFSHRMVTMWTDFAKHGTPSCDWTNYNDSDNFYMHMEDDMTIKCGKERKDHRNFWTNILPRIDKYGKMLEAKPTTTK